MKATRLLLLAALWLGGCGIDFSTPRAYRCSSDEECRGGWRCLGDQSCHDPDAGVATPCAVSADCAGGWKCLGDKVCHDPSLGVTLACVVDDDCAASWRCLGDRLCHDPVKGLSTPCVADGDCAGGWQCLSDKVCHDPSIGVTIACVSDAQCTAGWRCLGDKLCHDPSLGTSTSCLASADCAGGWMCLGDRLCHDPMRGASTPCVADGDCAAGWMCLGDNLCHDPAIGVATRCVADGDCAGGWMCLGDNVCHDPALGVTTPCVVDGDCAASWRCLGDKLCHDPARGATTACASSADCAGGFRCADRLCRDPSVGITLPCLTAADCLGGWYCSGDRVCRDPSQPGPFSCSMDSECAGGWRCSVQQVCANAAAELAAVPPPVAAPTAQVLSPLGPEASLLRVAAPLTWYDAASGQFTRMVTMTTAEPGAIVATTLGTSVVDGGTSASFFVSTVQLPLDAGVVVDAIVAGGTALVVLDGGTLLKATASGWAPVSRVAGPAVRVSTLSLSPSTVVPVAYFTDAPSSTFVFAPALLFLPDGGEQPWGNNVVDLARGSFTDAQPIVAATLDAGYTKAGGSILGDQLVFTLPDAGTVGRYEEAWSGQPRLKLSELRTLGDVVAGAWRQGFAPRGGIANSGAEHATVIYAPRWEKSLSLSLACQDGEDAVDFELVQDPLSGPVLQCACRSPGSEDVFVYAKSLVQLQPWLVDRPSALCAGAGGVHVRQNAWGAQRVGVDLLADETSVRLSSRPSLLGGVPGLMLAVAERQVFSLVPDAGFVVNTAETNPALAPVDFVRGTDVLVFGGGVGVSLPPADGGSSQVKFVLAGTPHPSRVVGQLLGVDWVISADDVLYAGSPPSYGVALLPSVLRPAPGFPVEAVAVRATDAGIEGWLVSNNQLFRVEANTLDRWRSTSWPVQGHDVLSAWLAGGSARVGTTTGEVFSLPSRVVVAPAWPGGVSSMTGRCGEVLATAGSDLLSLGADGGWAVVPLGLRHPLRGPRLVDAKEALYLTDEQGVVLQLSLDGGCP